MSCKNLFKSAYHCGKCTDTDCPLRVKAEEESFQIITDFDYIPKSATGVVIDIGTTTLAALSLENGKINGQYSALNRQRIFGADVISRIEASNKGNKAQLQRIIRQQVNECISRLHKEADNIIVCANTAMASLFMGYDCSLLGVYPFKAQNVETVHDGKFTVIGAISGFVGGDITSGLYMCGFDLNDKINLFIDLGTNGEIAIGNKNSILCTSVAMGPAFEGGNISCGSGAINGALTSVSFKDEIIKTIGNVEAQTICGSGIIELVSELIVSGGIDRSGCMREAYNGIYRLTDKISITQQDIRNIQTAKSALRTGIETVMREYSVNEKDIANVFISGGFSKYLDIDKACNIGLLPKSLYDKYKCVGNSSLGGGIKILENGLTGIEMIRSVSSDFSLATDDKFNELFMKYMYF